MLREGTALAFQAAGCFCQCRSIWRPTWEQSSFETSWWQYNNQFSCNPWERMGITWVYSGGWVLWWFRPKRM
jgi:hypothetical protein